MLQASEGKRWLYLLNAVILLLFLGLVYSWSNFVKPLEDEFGWVRSQTSLAFSICMSFFCIGGFVSGLLLKTRPPRQVIFLCGLCVSSGFMLTSRTASLSGLYVAYGILVGFGIGLAYNCVISVVVKWFPEKPGLISGTILMGFGLGGMVLGTASTAMISSFGWRAAFFRLGVTFCTLIFLSSFFVKAPPKQTVVSNAAKREKVSSASMISQRSFWAFFAWAALLSSAGLALIGNASPLAIDMGSSLETASLFTGVISIFNGAGRVIMGYLCDKAGHRKSMAMISLGFVFAFAIVALALTSNSLPLLALGYLCGGFSFGGIVPINSAVCYDFYGSENYATNLSIVTFNVLIASFLGPFLAAALQIASGSFISVAVLMMSFGALSLLLSLSVRKP